MVVGKAVRLVALKDRSLQIGVVKGVQSASPVWNGSVHDLLWKLSQCLHNATADCPGCFNIISPRDTAPGAMSTLQTASE